MTITVNIPGRFTLSALYPFSRSVVRSDGFPMDTDIVFDFRWLCFIDGSGLTVLCNTLECPSSEHLAQLAA
jgi:anti-anti-sigma regulatory factor